jgi:hypothetical protein
LPRRASKSFASAARVAHFPVGRNRSGACAFLERSGITVRIVSSLPLAAAAFSGAGGDFMIFPETKSQMVCSVTAICSAVSAMDHLSGPALNFHWASETPSIAARNSFCVCFKYSTARSRSSFVNELDSAAELFRAAGEGELWP